MRPKDHWLIPVFCGVAWVTSIVSFTYCSFSTSTFSSQSNPCRSSSGKSLTFFQSNRFQESSTQQLPHLPAAGVDHRPTNSAVQQVMSKAFGVLKMTHTPDLMQSLYAYYLIVVISCTFWWFISELFCRWSMYCKAGMAIFATSVRGSAIHGGHAGNFIAWKHLFSGHHGGQLFC